MKFTEGLTNIQNIPGNDDLGEIVRNEQNYNSKKDNRQVPSDTVIAPIKDPLYEKDQRPINEIPREPQRIMKNYIYCERRIF